MCIWNTKLLVQEQVYRVIFSIEVTRSSCNMFWEWWRFALKTECKLQKLWSRLKFLCRLRSIVTHRNHFVRRLYVCPSVCHTHRAMFCLLTSLTCPFVPSFLLAVNSDELSSLSKLGCDDSAASRTWTFENLQSKITNIF